MRVHSLVTLPGTLTSVWSQPLDKHVQTRAHSWAFLTASLFFIHSISFFFSFNHFRNYFSSTEAISFTVLSKDHPGDFRCHVWAFVAQAYQLTQCPGPPLRPQSPPSYALDSHWVSTVPTVLTLP